jgi:signal transduction histidine kinase/CheY-like chemotaxis protein
MIGSRDIRVAPQPLNDDSQKNVEELLNRAAFVSDVGDAPSFSSILPNLPEIITNFDATQHGDQLAHPEHELYTPTLQFRNKRDGELYRKHMKKQVYPPLIVIMLIAANAISIHSWFTTLFSSGPWFIMGFVVNVLVITAFSIFLFVQYAIYTKASTASFLGKLSDFFLNKALWGEYESFVCILATLALCLFLYGRVAVGECIHDSEFENDLPAVPSNGLHWWSTDDITTRWPLLGCNPEAAVKMPPQDSVMRLFLVPAVFQVCVKGASKYAVLASWCLSTACLIACAVRLDNLEGNVWVLLYPSLFLLLAYEHERFKMASFLTSKLALETAVLSEKVRHEQKVTTLLAARDREAKEKEQEMLRSLIGNVAHDMKTPLQSMTMGLDAVRMGINEISKQIALFNGGRITVNKPFMARLEQESHDTSVSTGVPLTEHAATVSSILASAEDSVSNMEASCSFMSMSINRAIDFAKVSRNIALVPKIESFDLVEAIATQIRCVNSLRTASSTPLIILDLSFATAQQIRQRVLSDKQWLSENLLCLLSNAVKYSEDNSVVKVSVSLERMHTLSGGQGDLKGIHPDLLLHGGIVDGVLSAMKTFRRQFRTANKQGHNDIFDRDLENGSGQIDAPSPGSHAGGGGGAGFMAATPSLALSKKSMSQQALVPPSPHARLSRGPSTHQSLRKISRTNSLSALVWTDMLRITVEDCGAGLSDEAMDKLFQPLKQGQRFTGGTGLGLFSLTKRSDALGGRCGVHAREDGKSGCAFWFAFPYRPDYTAVLDSIIEEKDAPIKSSIANLTDLVEDVNDADTSGGPRGGGALRMLSGSPDAAGNRETGSECQLGSRVGPKKSNSSVEGLRILVVDDSQTILRMVSRTLEEKGFIVDTAKNGAVALEKMMKANADSSSSATTPLTPATAATATATAAELPGMMTSTPSGIEIATGGGDCMAEAACSCSEKKETTSITIAAAAVATKSVVEKSAMKYDAVLIDIQMPVMGKCDE